MNSPKKIGIVLIFIAVVLYILVPQVFGWVTGALWGAGLALAFLFKSKKDKAIE